VAISRSCFRRCRKKEAEAKFKQISEAYDVHFLKGYLKFSIFSGPYMKLLIKVLSFASGSC